MSEIQRRINAATGVNRGQTARANRNRLMSAMIRRGYRRDGPNSLRGS